MENIDNSVVIFNLDRMISQTFKLLPMREEDQEWKKPLETLCVELLGMSNIFLAEPSLFSAACKLKGMWELGEDLDFMAYRRTIFEICGLLGKAKNTFS